MAPRQTARRGRPPRSSNQLAAPIHDATARQPSTTPSSGFVPINAPPPSITQEDLEANERMISEAFGDSPPPRQEASLSLPTESIAPQGDDHTVAVLEDRPEPEPTYPPNTVGDEASSPPPTEPVMAEYAHSPPRDVEDRDAIEPTEDAEMLENDQPSRPKILKFKPKSFIRRSQAERDALGKAEAERQSGRTNTRNTRGRPVDNGSRRGRGGVVLQASGVLGGDPVRESVPGVRRGRGGAGRRGGRGGSRGGDGGDGSAVAEDDVEAEQNTAPKETAVVEPRRRSSARVKKEGKAKAGAEEAEVDQEGDTIMGATASRRRGGKSSGKTKIKIKNEDEKLYDYGLNDDEEDIDGARRIPIAEISLISDDEDDDMDLTENARGKQRAHTPRPGAWQLFPVYPERHEHVEREKAVNTDASSWTAAELRRKAKEKQEATGSLFLPDEEAAQVVHSTTQTASKRRQKDLEVIRDDRVWKGVYEDEDVGPSVVIKPEPEEDPMLVDVVESSQQQPREKPNKKPPSRSPRPSTVESQRQVNRESPSSQLILEDHEDHVSHQQPTKRLRKRGYQNVTPELFPQSIEEDEDFAEVIRIWKEIRGLDVDADPSLQDDVSSSATLDNHPNEAFMDLKGDPTRHGNSYLIQLPPVLPSLRDINTPAPKPKTEQKAKTPPSNPFNPSIKPDPDASDSHKDSRLSNFYSVTSMNPPAGYTGTFTIYTNGTMEADLGGLKLDVQQSQQAGFAQEVLLHDYEATTTKVEDEEKWEEIISCGTDAWAVGKIEGGFVAGPGWDSLLG